MVLDRRQRIDCNNENFKLRHYPDTGLSLSRHIPSDRAYHQTFPSSEHVWNVPAHAMVDVEVIIWAEAELLNSSNAINTLIYPSLLPAVSPSESFQLPASE